MNIGIIGTGGVGGYFGGKLSQLLNQQTHDLNIYFIARNQHLQAIKNNGLLLDTDEGQYICHPTLATDNISDLPQLDLCLICIKSYDLENVLIQLKPKISEHTMILPLLNGVDIYERIRLIIKKGTVFPSCVYVGTHIEKPGHVKQRGGTCTIHLGKDPENDQVNSEIFKLMESSNIKYIWSDSPYHEIWSKFIFVAAFGLVTAAYHQTIGEVMQSEESSQTVKKIMDEIYQISIKKHISLSPSIVNDSFLKGKKFPFDTKTSFQRDYEAVDKPDERELFGGTIIRSGKQTNVKTPVTEKVYEIIQNNKKLTISS